MIEMYIGLHIKYSLFLSDCNESYFFIDRFSKNTHIQNFINILPLSAVLFLADGWTDGQTERKTDMTKLNVAFRNSENASTNRRLTNQRKLTVSSHCWKTSSRHGADCVTF